MKFKKLLTTLGFSVTTIVACSAQGTIAFGNSVGTPIKIYGASGNPSGHNMTAAEQAQYNIAIGVFYGPAGSQNLTQLAPGLGLIGQTPGVLGSISGNNVLHLFTIPGTSPDGGSVVALEVRLWISVTGEIIARTGVRDVTLSPAAGPGTVIWQGATGTSPNRFNPPAPVPEPSSILLAGVGVSGLFLLRRRRMRQERSEQA